MAYLGLIFFMIITFMQPQEFIPSVKGLPLAFITMLLVTLFFFGKLKNQKKNIFRIGQQVILMVFFWLVITFSTLKLMCLQYTIDTFIDWGKVVLIFLLLATLIDSERKILKLFWTVVLSLCVTAVMGIMQYYGNDVTGIGMIEGRITGIGIFATNQLAYALCYIFPICFALFLMSRNAIYKLILIIIFVLYIYCLYLTQSRGGYLCFLIVVFLLISKFNHRKFIKILGFFLSMLLFIILIKLAPRFSTSFKYQEDSSAIGRIDAWGYGLIELKQNLGFGIGKGQFVENFRRAAHNSFIETATELGLVGLFVWIALFYFSIKNLRLISSSVAGPQSMTMITISKALEVSLYAYLVGCYFSSSEYYIPLYVLFAFIVAIQALNNSKMRYTFRLQDILNIMGYAIGMLIFLSILSRTT